MVERDSAYLVDMLLAAREAVSLIAEMDEAAFRRSRLHQHAVIRLIAVIGEAARHVSRPIQEENPHIDWRDMIGMRNRLIHGYGAVRPELVWTVVSIRVPALIVDLERLIPDGS